MAKSSAGSNAELENEVPYSSQEKSRDVDLLDSALESEKYRRKQEEV